jgi:hypothetical protein
MAADASVPTILNSLSTPRAGRLLDLAASPTAGPGTPQFRADMLFTPEYEYWFCDFSATAITAATSIFTAGMEHTWAYAESASNPADPSKLTPTRIQSSDMRFSAFAAAAHSQTMLGPKMYSANKNPFVEVRLQTSSITDLNLNIGFADAIPAAAAKIVSDIDTPAVTTMADGAIYAIDPSQTLVTAALVCVGTSTAVNKVNVAPVTAPFGVLTAGVYAIIRVELVGNGQISGKSVANLYINDVLAATSANGPDSEKLLSPVILTLTPATALNVDIDYIRCGQQKALSPF